MRRSPSRRARGFTLMEVLLVLVILVVLASLAGVFLTRAQQQANVSAAQTQIGMFKSPLQFYRLHMNRFPTTQQGLAALRQPPADLTNPAKWQGPYLDQEIPFDPWENEYVYESDGESYSITSFGPDGQQNTVDDIIVTSF